jgi:hypothetical protein
MRDAFVTKYYGKLDAFIYGKMLEEINKAVEHMASYSSDEHKPNKEILELMEEKQIEVVWKSEGMSHEYDASEILCSGCMSTCLREDYKQGVNSDCSGYFYYACQCDCGFSKDIKYEEKNHKIVEKPKK